MKLALIGRSMISPFGLAIRPRMPASWRICLNEPRAPELAIMKMGFRTSRLSSIASATSSVAAFHCSTTASWRSSCVIRPMSYWSWISATCVLVLREDLALGRRHEHVVLGDRDAGLRRVLEAEVLERVEHLRDRRRAVGLHELVDELRRVALLHRAVDELVGRGSNSSPIASCERPLDAVVVDDPADRREDVAALAARAGGTRRGRAASTTPCS